MANQRAEDFSDPAMFQRGGSPSRGAIRIPKTAEIVAASIRRRIIRGELQEDDFLPHEAQLMETFGVSRPTLREAFRILESEMLISVVRGSRTGARVHAPRVDSVSRYAGFVLQSEQTTVRDIYEARIAIEPFAARQLAETQPEGATERLRGEVARLTAMVDEARYVDFMIGLAGFHHMLVAESGNRTLLLMTTILQDVVAKYQVDFLRKRNLDPETQRERALWGLRSFGKLLDFIDAGDADRAESHWRLHVKNSNRVWVDSIDPDQVIEAVE